MMLPKFTYVCYLFWRIRSEHALIIDTKAHVNSHDRLHSKDKYMHIMHSYECAKKGSCENMLLTLNIIDESCPVAEFVVTIKAWRTSKIISNCIYHRSHQLSERMISKTKTKKIFNITSVSLQWEWQSGGKQCYWFV